MVRRLGVAGVSSPLQWSPGQTVRSIEGRSYTFLGGGHPALYRPSHMPSTTITPCHLPYDTAAFSSLLSLAIFCQCSHRAFAKHRYLKVSRDVSSTLWHIF
ncbi:hypothetical protein ALC57_14670 [Trachymyrmex cornetzi]|uniref:Uncharacterized protein n=1 Tax=Trachymyrmex cornetzi TaxID=471704 RepID=A0A151IXS7_9HYME|nr:hypothetical protein ALC57_14670 [Trachymyrmex cornetzi]